MGVEISQGAHLVEESVKDGLYGFRNIVCWKNGDLQLKGNPRVKRFWSGKINEVDEANQGKQVKTEMEPGWGRRLSEPSKLHWPCLTPENCPIAGYNLYKENQPQDSPHKPDKKIARTRAGKRPLEDVVATCPDGPC